MRNHRDLAWIALAAVFCLGAAAPADRAVPPIYSGLDADLVSLEPDSSGVVLTAWTYGSGRETDVAIAVRDAEGRWSRPVLFGQGDGQDQVRPALTRDMFGTVYLAYAVRQTGKIVLTALPARAQEWTAPEIVSLSGERAYSPALLAIDGHIVLAYGRAGGTTILDLPLLAPIVPLGVQDGPDIIPPTGKWKGPPPGDPSGFLPGS